MECRFQTISSFAGRQAYHEGAGLCVPPTCPARSRVTRPTVRGHAAAPFLQPVAAVAVTVASPPVSSHVAAAEKVRPVVDLNSPDAAVEHVHAVVNVGSSSSTSSSTATEQVQPVAHVSIATAASEEVQPVTSISSSAASEQVQAVASSSSDAASEQMQAVVDSSQQLVITVLTANLHTTPDEAAKLFRRNAAVALRTEWDIQARIADIQSLLSIPQEESIALIRKEPRLLTADMSDLKQHLTDLSSVCKCTTEQATGMVLSKPFLLMLSASKMEEKVNFLKDALHLHESQLHTWIVTHPSVLCHSMHSMTDKLAWLESFFGTSSSIVGQLAAKNPFILELSNDRLRTEISAMSKLVGVKGLFRMVQQEPRLMTITTSRFQQRITDLQQLLNLKDSEAVRMLKQRPALACKSLRSLQAARKVLKKLPISEQQVSELIDAHPLLLRLSPRVLYRRCNGIRYVVRRSKVYRYVLGKLPPHLWGVVLMHWDSAASKICYLADSAQEVKMSLLDVLRATDDEQFQAAFPEYREWRQLRRARGKDSRSMESSPTQSEGRTGRKLSHSRSRRHSPRRASTQGTGPSAANGCKSPGVEDTQMCDFSHYADLPAEEHIGRYRIHRPQKPKQRAHAHSATRSRAPRSHTSSSSTHQHHLHKSTSNSSTRSHGNKLRNSAVGKEGSPEQPAVDEAGAAVQPTLDEQEVVEQATSHEEGSAGQGSFDKQGIVENVGSVSVVSHQVLGDDVGAHEVSRTTSVRQSVTEGHSQHLQSQTAEDAVQQEVSGSRSGDGVSPSVGLRDSTGRGETGDGSMGAQLRLSEVHGTCGNGAVQLLGNTLQHAHSLADQETRVEGSQTGPVERVVAHDHAVAYV